jgi:hypothetical protein
MKFGHRALCALTYLQLEKKSLANQIRHKVLEQKDEHLLLQVLVF